MSYSSLHNHSMYSITDGFSTVEEYLSRASELGLKSVAITEHGNVFSAPYIHKAKKNYPNLKVIYGYEAYECLDREIKDVNNKYWHLLILAKNERGRIALNELITLGEFDGFYFKGRITAEDLRSYANDIIVTSACMASKLHREEDYQKCIDYINHYKEILGENFFLEMQSHRSNDQAEYNKKILQLSKDTNTPFIITTDSHAATEQQLKYQGYFVQISHDADAVNEAYEGCYMQSEYEIHQIMDGQIGVENVDLGLENTNVLADMIEDVQMPFREPQMPSYPIPEGYTQRSYVEKLLEDGWKWRGFDKMSEEDQRIRRERIQEEMDTIDQMGYLGYFIITWDFINWGRENGVLFGVSRGSAGSSMVTYLLGITGLDPIKYGLVFSRFLNSERAGLPDIDTDVSERDLIISYLQSKYGKDSVCQIANFSYVTPGVAITDTARVLDKSKERFEKYGKTIGVKTAREIAKLFAYETWDECLRQNGASIKKYSEPIYNELFEVASQLSGKVRHCAVHAGGVGIVDGKITDIMPVRNADGARVLMADKKMAEPLSVIKFDILGVKTLSVIDEATRLAGINPWEIDPMNEDFLYDEKTYEMLGRGDTDNVFQMESLTMSGLNKKIKPKNPFDISVINALARPDTMAMMDEFVGRRTGELPVTYPHPDMKPILEETLGVQAYQEQTLQIIRKYGGWSYGRSDLFRRAVSKKIPEEVKRLVDELRVSIIENGYPEETADQICTLLRDKGGYEFNKSHSCGYGITALQTAYLKAHYTEAFYTAVLNGCAKDNSKVNKNVIKAIEHGVKVLPPNINKSQTMFSLVNKEIFFGLSAISGIGEAVVDKIIEERNVNGQYTGVINLIERVPELNTKQVVNLIKSGAFGGDNKEILLEKYLKHTIKQSYSDKKFKPYKEVKSLPSLLILKTEYGIDTKDKDERVRLYNEARRKEHETTGYEAWKSERKAKMQKEFDEMWEKYGVDKEYWEYETLSVFLSNNPFTEVYSYIQRPFDAVEDGQEMFDVGIISSIQRKRDKNKKTYCYIRLYTVSGVIEGTVFATAYAKFIDLIAKGNKIAVYGEKVGDTSFIVKNIETLDNWMRRSNIRIGGKK